MNDVEKGEFVILNYEDRPIYTDKKIRLLKDAEVFLSRIEDVGEYTIVQVMGCYNVSYQQEKKVTELRPKKSK